MDLSDAVKCSYMEQVQVLAASRAKRAKSLLLPEAAVRDVINDYPFQKKVRVIQSSSHFEADQVRLMKEAVHVCSC